MTTMFKAGFTRDALGIFAEASGLGEDMLEPDAVGIEQTQDATRLQLSQTEKPKIQIGPLFGVMAALLILGLLVSGGQTKQLSSGRRFR